MVSSNSRVGPKKATPKKATPKKATPKNTKSGARGDRLSTIEKANLLIRQGIAASFDLFLLYVPAGVVGWVVLAFGIIICDKVGWATPTDSINQLTPWAVSFWVLGSLLAETISTARWGTTPGKRIVKLGVTERSGKKPTLIKMLERAAWKQIPIWAAAMLWPSLVIAVVGIWIVFWLRSSKMLHDHLARTVIKNRI